MCSYALMPAPSPPSKQFWNWFYEMAFRAAVVRVLLLISSVSSKYLYFKISFIIRNRKKLFGLDLVNREGVPAQLFVYYLKSLSLLALIQALTFLCWHTKIRLDNNRSHSERDCCTSTRTQLWNTDMPMSSNHTEVSVHGCHGKHTVTSLQTSLSCWQGPAAIYWTKLG
jgi:hypothetical protein